MGNVVLGVLVAVATGWFLQQLAKGGLRWRALTVANHELEAASRLAEDSVLALQLTKRAESRLETYLREPRRSSVTWMVLRLLIDLTGALYLLGYVLVVREESVITWVFAIGGSAGVFLSAMDARRLLMRRPAPTRFSPPDSANLTGRH